MSKSKVWSKTLKSIGSHAAYYPTLLINGALCWLRESQLQIYRCLKLAPLFILLITQFSSCFAESEYKKILVSKKIDISQPDVKTELLVHVSREDNYSFSLDFKYQYKNQEDRARVSALMEGKDAYGHRTNGEKTPVSVEVYAQKDGQTLLVSLGRAESIPLSSWGGGEFRKVIYTDYLMPGDYRVAVDSKAGNPNFKDVDVELHIGLAHKPK